MEPKTEDSENSKKIDEKTEITKKQRLFLSISDFLMIGMIIADGLYMGELLSIAPGNILFLNIVVVSIAFVGYQLKKRIRKINRRKRKAMVDSTPQ